MRAAVLEEWGAPLVISEVPDPQIGTGEIIVDVVSARVLNYTREVLSGDRNYLLALPAIPGPGGIGRVRAVGPDATKVAVGDLVFCDSTIRSRDDALDPDITLQGWSARDRGGERLQQFHRNGSFAEQMRVPTENATVIPPGPGGSSDADDVARYCVLGSLLVPYGGLLAAELKAGETIVVNGATGGFGSAAVAVALAMGAERVVATGRNVAALRALTERHGRRVAAAAMTGDVDADRVRIADAADGPIDCLLDLLPPAAAHTPGHGGHPHGAPQRAHRPHGGVASDLDLNYRWLMRNCISIRGQWMYPRTAVPTMIGMVRAGLVDLGAYTISEFDLDHANEAVEYAAAHAEPGDVTILRPNR
ncbi:MAG: alcohol dehydrogenase catalytic domain-containing protein [Ilumatobacteraceae bacterium]